MLWTMNFWNRCVPAKNNYPALSQRGEICFEGVFFFFTIYIYNSFNISIQIETWSLLWSSTLAKLQTFLSLYLTKSFIKLLKHDIHQMKPEGMRQSLVHMYYLNNIIEKTFWPLFGIEDLWVYTKLASLTIPRIHDILSSAL